MIQLAGELISSEEINSKKEMKKNNKPQNFTRGVETLLGDPKKAILKLAIPMIIAMSANTIYNVVDAIWVSGLGYDQLEAVGHFFPFFFMAMAISTGLGIGGGAAISRRIGAKDKTGADNVAVHTIIIMVISAICFTIPFLIFTREIFLVVSAGRVIDFVVAYGRIMFAGTIVIFFSMVANSILRAEGDANRAMYVMMFGAILNIILDPFFIFGDMSIGGLTFSGLGYGVAGAAYATVISLSISGLVMFYWLFLKKNTYISFNFRNFKWDKNITSDISRVGLPASVQQFSMAFTMMITNIIIVWVDVPGGVGVSVFTAGWRIVTIGILPLLGIATAVISVTGASYGARNLEKLKISFNYAIKMGLIIELGVAIATFLFAPQLALAFSYTDKSIVIRDDLITFLQVIFLFYPTVAFGMFSSAMFQGTGKGTNSLIVTLFRTVILAPPFCIIFSEVLGMGLLGIWLGIVVANITGSLVAYFWARYYLKTLKEEFKKPGKIPVNY
jgi:putative MATE family efflux protein